MSEECNLDVLRLEHDPPEDFGDCVCSSSGSMSTIYLLVRDLFTSYHFAVFIADIVLICKVKDLKLYIFFDFWTQVLLFFSSEVGLYGIVRRTCEDASEFEVSYWDYVPWYCKLYWALLSAALPSTVLSCVLYWTQSYKKEKHIVHILMNSVSPGLAILEFLMIAFPIRLLNFFYFVIFYIIYVLFTLLYQKRGGTGAHGVAPIYTIVNWENPKKAVLKCSFGLAIGVGAYIIFCFISMAKNACRNRGDYF